MPQKELQAFLSGMQTSDRVRAAAWDAVYNVADDAEAERLLTALSLPDHAKATLWDYRTKGEAPAPEGSATSRFLSNAAEMLNPIAAVKGIAHAVANPIDTYHGMVDASAEQFGKAREAFGSGRYAEAAGHGLAGAVPVIGPAAANAGEQIAAGDIAGGMGSMTGLAGGAALAGPTMRAVQPAMKPAAQAVGRRLYQSALKPSKATLNDVRPAAGMTAQETLLQTGLNEGAPITARGVRKVETLIDSLDGEVQSRIAKIQASGEKVDPALVEQAIDDVVRDFTEQINAQPELAAIDTVRKNFQTNPLVTQQVAPATQANFASGQMSGTPAKMQAGPIDPAVAQRMKTNTYQGLRGKYGRELNGTIEAEKAGARGLREGIEQAGARAGVTDIAAVNAREGSLISLEHALSDALRRRGNYDVLGLKPAIGASAAAASGSALPLLVTLVDRFPGIVSRTGIWINRAGSGRVVGRAGKAAVAGTTTPSESRNQTTAPGLPLLQPGR